MGKTNPIRRRESCETNPISAGGWLYKQTQSGGQIVRNKANLPLRGCRAPDAQPPIRSRAGSTRSRLRQTKPNLHRMGNLGAALHGGILRERAQFPASRAVGASSSCQTKPISGNVGGPGLGCTNKPNRPEGIMRNKPNFGRWLVVQTNPICHPARWGQQDPSRQTRRARQKSGSTEPTPDIGPETRVETQLGDFCRGRQTKPIPAIGRGCQGRDVPNKAKLGQAGASGGRCTRVLVARNKANFSIADCGLRILDCGFREAGGRSSEFARPAVQTNPIGRSQSCETKPICSAPPGGAAGARDLVANVQNKPDSHGSSRSGGGATDNCERSAAIRHRLPAARRRTEGLRSRLTNPGALATIRAFHGLGVQGISPAVYGG
jgi:hypothetical protein